MADIQLTDDLGHSVPNVKIDLNHPSSLLKYAKAELLHLAVLPDFGQLAPQPISKAAPKPISFQLKLEHKFQLGNTKPEIDLTPSFAATIRANATPGSNLFEKDAFRIAAKVPDNTSYVSLGLQGSLTLGVSGSSGDLTFGLEANGALGLEYWKAFPLGGGEPTLGAATGQTISGFVIPADIEDLKMLGVHDVCTASGQGSLKISGAFQVSVTPNPLASAALPLNAGKVEVKAGAMAGLSASFTINGSYQVRARRTSSDVIELSFCKQRGTLLKAGLSASGGVSAKFGDTDLLKALLGAIGTNPTDEAAQKLFADGGLSKEEIGALAAAIKDGLNHSLQASLDVALSQLSDDQAAFQYEIRPALLDAASSAAVHRALEGDLSILTELEQDSEAADLAPGVRLISSVMTKVRKRQTSLKLNLLGLLNYLSLSEMIRKSVVVEDPESGEVTIADSATANDINAVVEPMRRQAALRKAMFQSMVITVAYRVSGVIRMPELSSHNFHFAFSQTTNRALLADYLNWFVVLNLINRPDREQYLGQVQGRGPSTCLLRTEFDDKGCRNMFFESSGNQWEREHYLEIGRQAMRALIDPNDSDLDRARYELLDQHWKEAVEIGPNDNLAGLMGLHLTDPTGWRITQYLAGDVYQIVWWANSMLAAGAAVSEMQDFIADADPVTLMDNHEFEKRRTKLQKKIANVVNDSRNRFEEPWGLVSLFWAAGSAGASGRLKADGLLIQKP